MNDITLKSDYKEVGYIEHGEFHDTEFSNPKDINYWAARLLVLGDYRNASRMYLRGNYYYVDVQSYHWGVDYEPVCFDENSKTGMTQAFFLEEYLRNDSYYKNDLWARAAKNVEKLDTETIRIEEVYNWHIGTLKECFRILAATAKSPEDRFNELCMDIAEKYCIAYADKVRDDWNPHENIEQLLWVFSTVVNYAGVDFRLYGDINDGMPQIYPEDEMRAYIKQYGRTI